ncbi:MAG: THUMP domain-containing protein [Desulfurococcales archaeon]|nr:THUMP domain-containing protein [Desulfurococcales archaeon]
MKKKYVATCNPGLEDITAKELEEELEADIEEIRQGRGRVLFSAGASEPLLSRIYRLRSVHSVALMMSEGRVRLDEDGLKDVFDIAYSSGVHKLIPYGSTFAVRATRIGEGHAYTSIDVARVTGDAVSRAYKDEYGVEPVVRLNAPSTAVYAEVDGDRYRVGLLIAGEHSLHRRGYRVYDHPAALKSTIAYAMLRLAGARDSSTILDPMCGGGTVAIEAALLFENAKIVCIDKSRRHIQGAIRNALAARVANRIRFIAHDATRLPEVLEQASIDYVVSNPPYGIKMGDPWSVRRLYDRFLPSLRTVMNPQGRAALITADPVYFQRAAERAGFRIVHARKVRHGDLWTTVFVLAPS